MPLSPHPSFSAYSMTIQILMTTLLTMVMTMVTACSKPIEHPETIDPIFNDLTKKAADYQSQLQSVQKAIAEEEKTLQGLKLGTIEVKQSKKTIAENKGKLTHLSQMAKYYEIRAKKRKISARREYLRAFKEGQPWPQQEPYQHYLLEQKLKLASRNWNERVPKLKDRLKRD